MNNSHNLTILKQQYQYFNLIYDKHYERTGINHNLREFLIYDLTVEPEPLKRENITQYIIKIENDLFLGENIESDLAISFNSSTDHLINQILFDINKEELILIERLNYEHYEPEYEENYSNNQVSFELFCYENLSNEKYFNSSKKLHILNVIFYFRSLFESIKLNQTLSYSKKVVQHNRNSN